MAIANSLKYEPTKHTHCEHKRFFTFIKKHLLIILALIGVLAGGALGFGLRRLQPSNDVIMWLRKCIYEKTVMP